MAPTAVPIPVRVTKLDEAGSSSVWVNGAAESMEDFQKFERELSKACKKSVYLRNVFAFREKEVSPRDISHFSIGFLHFNMIFLM